MIEVHEHHEQDPWNPWNQGIRHSTVPRIACDKSLEVCTSHATKCISAAKPFFYPQIKSSVKVHFWNKLWDPRVRNFAGLRTRFLNSLQLAERWTSRHICYNNRIAKAIIQTLRTSSNRRTKMATETTHQHGNPVESFQSIYVASLCSSAFCAQKKSLPFSGGHGVTFLKIERTFVRLLVLDLHDGRFCARALLSTRAIWRCRLYAIEATTTNNIQYHRMAFPLQCFANSMLWNGMHSFIWANSLTLNGNRNPRSFATPSKEQIPRAIAPNPPAHPPQRNTRKEYNVQGTEDTENSTRYNKYTNSLFLVSA